MTSPSSNQRRIPVTARNLWFLARSIPLFGLLDLFERDAIGPPAMGGGEANVGQAVRKLTIHTDQGWSFLTDIVSDQKIFRNSSQLRGTGKWVRQAQLKPGDAMS